MKFRFIISAAILGVLLCGCSRTQKTVPYENLGAGRDNPKAAPILKIAEACLEDFQEERWSSLYGRMSAETRSMLSKSQLAAQCEMLTRRFGVPASVEILEVHLADFPERRDSLPPMIMSGIEGHSHVLPNPVHLGSPVSGHVALILGKATSAGPGLKSWMTLVLRREDGAWGLVSFHMNNCEANGHDGNWFANRAQEFEEKGMRRIAFLYRNFGAQLLIPSPYIMVPSASRQLEAAATHQAPPNMPFPGARPSETWRVDDGTDFIVESVSIASAPTFLSLEVRYKSDQKEPDSPEAKTERKKLYEYVMECFPEYRLAFDGVFIGSITSWGKGFREYFPFAEDSVESVDISIDSNS